MLPVTAGFNTAMLQNSRNLDAKVFIQWEIPFISCESAPAAGKIVLQNITEASGSQIAQLFNGVTKPVYEQVGFTSVGTSNASAMFVTPFPTIGIRYASASPINKVRVIGKNGEYPVDFDVRTGLSGLSVLKSVSITGNTQIDRTIDLGGTYAGNETYIIVYKWSLPNATIKLLQINPCLIAEFTKDQIISMKVTESLDNGEALTIGSVASKSLSLVLDNSNNDFNPNNSSSAYGQYMKSNRRIMPYIGVWTGSTYEYVSMGVYYSDSWTPSENENQMTVTGLDIVAQFKNYKYSCPLAYPNSVYPYQILNEQLNNTSKFYWLDYDYSGTFNAVGSKIITRTADYQGTVRDVLFYLSEFAVGSIRELRRMNGYHWIHMHTRDVVPASSATATFENIYKKTNPNKTEQSPNIVYVYYPTGNVYANFAWIDESLISFDITDNPFCDGYTQANNCASRILNLHAPAYAPSLIGSKMAIQWQGNPALELDDVVKVYKDSTNTTYDNIAIYEQTFDYSGGLIVTTIGRII